MAFLVAVGGLQFAYCVLVGNYVGFSFSSVCLRVYTYMYPASGRRGYRFREVRGGGGGGGGIKSGDGDADPRGVRTAVQRLPVRLRRHGRPVRAHGQLADPDESGEPAGV